MAAQAAPPLPPFPMAAPQTMTVPDSTIVEPVAAPRQVTVIEPDVTHQQVTKTTNGSGESHLSKAFAAEMAALHSSSFKARRAGVLHGSLPIRPAKASTGKADRAHFVSTFSISQTTESSIARIGPTSASTQPDDAAVVSQTGYKNGVYAVLLQAYTVGQQLSFMFFTGIGFLLTTWARFLLVLPNTISQPVNIFSMFLFAFGASAILLVAAAAALISLVPVVGPLIQSVIDYVMIGPYGPSGVRSALYYKEFPEELKAGAQKVLASPIEPEYAPSDGSEEPRTIDLDLARYLSALCALVYLRDSRVYAQSLVGVTAPNQEVKGTARDPCPPYDRAIRDIAHDNLKLEYVPLCELPSRQASPQRPSTAAVGLFYSVDNPTFIILSFKGTTPTSFPDWLVDFTFPYLPANAELNAYGSVHQGFYRALFPRDVRAWADVEADGPWDLMRKGIRRTVCFLHKLQPKERKTDVNVWVTGHSLGAVLAQMFFAKAMQCEDEWEVEVGDSRDAPSHAGQDTGKGVYARAVLRDSYTFGTPIFGDVFSRGSFNNAVFAPKKGRRHDVWRFVNHADIVATGLPDLGDQSYDKGWLPAAISTASDTGGLGGLNQFTFTHVGQEVTLRGGSNSYVGPGTLWPWGTKIVIKGGTASKGPHKVRPYLSSVPKWLVFLQYVPVFGRLLAHSPILYAYQLEQCTASSADGQGQPVAWATDFWWSPDVGRFTQDAYSLVSSILAQVYSLIYSILAQVYSLFTSILRQVYSLDNSIVAQVYTFVSSILAQVQAFVTKRME